jgi:hypothetical protein
MPLNQQLLGLANFLVPMLKDAKINAYVYGTAIVKVSRLLDACSSLGVWPYTEHHSC